MDRISEPECFVEKVSQGNCRDFAIYQVIDEVESQPAGYGRLLAEGTRHFIAHWASLSGQKDSSIDLDVKAGQTYFIELTGQSLMTGISTNRWAS